VSVSLYRFIAIVNGLLSADHDDDAADHTTFAADAFTADAAADHTADADHDDDDAADHTAFAADAAAASSAADADHADHDTANHADSDGDHDDADAADSAASLYWSSPVSSHWRTTSGASHRSITSSAYIRAALSNSLLMSMPSVKYVRR
jgi:hypothetical protein